MSVQSIAMFRDDPAKELDAKRRYADALIRHTDPATAAAWAFPEEPAIMALALTQWQNDPEVQGIINKHFEGLAPSARSPGRDAIANEVLVLARKASSTDDKLKCYRLWAELTGLITKGGPVINNNDNRLLQNNTLFVVPTQPVTIEDEAAFERRAIAAQRKLTNRAS